MILLILSFLISGVVAEPVDSDATSLAAHDFAPKNAREALTIAADAAVGAFIPNPARFLTASATVGAGHVADGLYHHQPGSLATGAVMMTPQVLKMASPIMKQFFQNLGSRSAAPLNETVHSALTAAEKSYGTLAEQVLKAEARVVALQEAKALKEIQQGILRGEIGQKMSHPSQNYWTHSKTYEFSGKQQTVFQRNDLIDLNRVDPKGRTSLSLMQRGQPPIGPDNQPLNLHHMIQTERGSLSEVTQSFHKKYSKEIHINDNSIPSGIDRNTFARWRAEYWKKRILELTGDLK